MSVSGLALCLLANKVLPHSALKTPGDFFELLDQPRKVKSIYNTFTAVIIGTVASVVFYVMNNDYNRPEFCSSSIPSLPPSYSRSAVR